MRSRPRYKYKEGFPWPSMLTQEVGDQIIAILREGNYRSTACRIVGISYAAFNTWMHRGEIAPESIFARFRVAVLAAEREAERECLASILNAAKGDDWRAAAWYLEKGIPKHRFKAVTRTEVTGKNGTPVAIEHLKQLTDEELDALDRVATKLARSAAQPGVNSGGESGEGEDES